MTTRNRTDEDFCLAPGASFLDQAVARAYRVGGKHPHAKDVVLAHEQRRAAHRTAARPQTLRELAHRIRHLPRARRANGGTERGLDAVRWTDPVGKRDVPRVIRTRAVIGR